MSAPRFCMICCRLFLTCTSSVIALLSWPFWSSGAASSSSGAADSDWLKDFLDWRRAKELRLREDDVLVPVCKCPASMFQAATAQVLDIACAACKAHRTEDRRGGRQSTSLGDLIARHVPPCCSIGERAASVAEEARGTIFGSMWLVLTATLLEDRRTRWP